MAMVENIIALVIWLLFAGGSLFYLVREIMRTFFTYTLFKWHATLVRRGLYWTKRKDKEILLKNGLATMTINKGKRFEIWVESGLEIFFIVIYNERTKRIEYFEDHGDFRKRANREELATILQDYILFVLEKEKVKQDESSEATKEHRSVETNAFQLLPVTGQSLPIQQLIVQINEKAKELEGNVQQLALEERHRLEKLLHVRLPNLLTYAQSHEKEVVKVLEEAVDKLESWQNILTRASDLAFEKEKLLTQHITKP